jgi:hypothetical protein
MMSGSPAPRHTDLWQLRFPGLGSVYAYRGGDPSVIDSLLRGYSDWEGGNGEWPEICGGGIHNHGRSGHAEGRHGGWPCTADGDALREHLMDMSRVTLDAHAIVHRVSGETRITVTGAGRTLAAIQRLLPQEAMHLNGVHGWQIAATRQPHGVVSTGTTSDPHEVAELRGLGFAGILARGDFHPMRHLEIARGEPMM